MTLERPIVLIDQPKKPVDQMGMVTSESFFSFLYGTVSNFPYKRWGFSRQLDLSCLTHVMEDMYGSTQEVFVNSEEDRDRLRRDFKESTGKEAEGDWINKKGHAERTVTIYCGHDLRLYRSGVTHGNYSSVRPSTWDIYDRGEIPLLEIHTHPHDQLPSPADYLRLLLEGYYEGRRTVQGIMVLTPSRQILALPTPQTPLLSDTEADQLVDEASREIKEKVNLIESKGKQRIDAIAQKISTSFEIVMKELVKKVASGELSPEEGMQQAKASKERVDQLGPLIISRIEQGYSRKNNHEVNIALVDFARVNNIQLFTSTDMANFHIATA